MAIPKQVEQQMKEVEELEKAMQAPVQDDGQTADPQTQTTDAPPAAEAPSEPVQQPEPPKVEPQEDWQTKYSHLQGKYNAEIPRLHQQNKDLAAQLTQLQAKIEELGKPKPEPEVEDRLITEQDETAFGSDLVDMVRRATKEATRDLSKAHSAETSSLQAKIQELESKLANTSGDVSTLTFEQRLARAVPDFEAINTNPQWIAWLDEVDTFTGQSRRGFAEYQYNQGDVVEVKRLVDIFKGQAGVGTKQQERDQRQKELERQVQPSRNPTGSNAQPSAKLYTEPEISRLFDKVRQLNVQGKYDEASSLEAELTNAYIQGRVR